MEKNSWTLYLKILRMIWFGEGGRKGTEGEEHVCLSPTED